jgi:hypothetical protein
MLVSYYCCTQVNCAYTSHFINSTAECGVQLQLNSDLSIFVNRLKNILQSREINYLCFPCHPRRTLLPIVVTASWEKVKGERSYPPGTMVPVNHVRARVVLCYGPATFLHVDMLCYMGLD